MKHIKSHYFFITAFSFTILVFLHPLIFMKSSFLYGDSFTQFYPWLKCYSDAIKNFSFPYWIKGMGSGFPLMAEGQVGGFYPLNIALFFLLPFKAAYNYAIIIHFIIGGVATYLFTRKIGSDETGGYLAALLFCFGSAYAGCFYNIVTLRTLAWFPLVLLLFEYYFSTRRVRYVLYSGMILGCQFLAGFIQMAAYSAFFYIVYFIYRSICEGSRLKSVFKGMIFFILPAMIIALPQLILTYQLSLFSGRDHATLGFSLWRSWVPLSLLSAVFPVSFSSSNAHFYVGVLSILFIIFSVVTPKKNNGLKALFLILFLSLFFAIGRFNPLYVWSVKILKLYFFRNPSKFLFFGIFALSAAAGYGFTKFFETGRKDTKDKAVYIFRAIIFFAAGLFLTAKILLRLFKDNILVLGSYIVENFIYGKPHHRYGLGYYMEGVRSFYAQAVNNFSFSNMFVLFSWLLIILSISVLLFRNKRKIKNICLGLIFVDLYIFSLYGAGFGGNIKPFTSIGPDVPNIFEYIKKDVGISRIVPFDIKSRKLPNWANPNSNIIYGIDSVASYTPLALKHYKDSLSGLEVVDDSLGLEIPSESAPDKYSETLSLLNAGYLISDIELKDDLLEKVASENGNILYRFKYNLPRAFFCAGIDTVKIPAGEPLKIIAYKDGFIEIESDSYKGGFVVFSENYYPGWHVYVDGVECALIKVKGLVQAVAVPSGAHRIIFKYRPEFFIRK